MTADYKKDWAEILKYNRGRVLPMADERAVSDFADGRWSLSILANDYVAGVLPTWREAQEYRAACSYLEKRRGALGYRSLAEREFNEDGSFLDFELLFWADLDGPDLEEYNRLLRRLQLGKSRVP